MSKSLKIVPVILLILVVALAIWIMKVNKNSQTTPEPSSALDEVANEESDLESTETITLTAEDEAEAQRVVEERKKADPKQHIAIMDFVTKNFNQLAPQKPLKGEWQVDYFQFYSDTDFYVFYSATDENDDDYLEEKVLLLRANPKNGSFTFDRLAYIKIADDETEEDVVLEGDDIYLDTEPIFNYEWDEDTNQWEPFDLVF